MGPAGTTDVAALRHTHLLDEPQVLPVMRWSFKVFPCTTPRIDPRKAQTCLPKGEGGLHIIES